MTLLTDSGDNYDDDDTSDDYNDVWRFQFGSAAG